VTKTPTYTPQPPPAPSFTGELAIPLRLGFQRKVYITGFDGAGINGLAPISMFGQQPMFRRDGARVIVNGTQGDVAGIFVTSHRGEGRDVIVDCGDSAWPVLSPDGSEIVYVQTTDQNKLFRRNSTGTVFEVQTGGFPLTGQNLLWSDDNRLVFQGCETWHQQNGECGTWVTDADQVAPVRIIVGNHARPMDARHGLLTYMSDEDGDWDVYLMPLAGGNPINLTRNDVQDGLAAIAPDGQSVAYISNQSGTWGLWTVTLRNGVKQHWFDIDPQRGIIEVDEWQGERMSWTR
jgi:Tol biopolymer transport system component